MQFTENRGEDANHSLKMSLVSFTESVHNDGGQEDGVILRVMTAWALHGCTFIGMLN
jgi:hypothetical protein